MRGVHGEKIVAAIESQKTPEEDKIRLQEALLRYDEWVVSLRQIESASLDCLTREMVALLNRYKNYIDVDLIFDSPRDFLYRQKGQLKLDNTVMEEFLPIYVRKCLSQSFDTANLDIESQINTFSSVYFASGLNNPTIGGGLRVKTKDQDFSISRKLFLKSSHEASFPPEKTVTIETNIGYVLAELKTNLDKTMFQEACATAHDVKQAVTGAKYYLLCDFLDMTPVSTATTDIDEILIMRKSRRISANVRKDFNTANGRRKQRAWYKEYLLGHPYSWKIFRRFAEHIISQLTNEELIEANVLEAGYF